MSVYVLSAQPKKGPSQRAYLPTTKVGPQLRPSKEGGPDKEEAVAAKHTLSMRIWQGALLAAARARMGSCR